jgi:DNA-binding NarL/FixJ family response regulator
MIHVLVADRVPLFRCGIRAALESTPECKVVGEATERAGIIQLLQEQHPDVIVLDAGLLAPDDLFEVTDALRPLACGLVVLTASADEEQLFQYLKLGAAAYESRDITPACLADRVRRVVQKEYLLSADAIDHPRSPSPTAPRTSPALKIRIEAQAPTSTFPLSAREVEILVYIAQGNSNKQIAKSLHISDQTVKNHITSILKKLSVNDRTAAVVHALRHRWISLEVHPYSRHPSEQGTIL